MPTELSISDPGLPLAVPLEGERIYEYWLAFFELYVISAAILERHAKPQRLFLDSDSRESCILELAKAPFVGIGYELYTFGLYYPVGFAWFSGLDANFVMRNQQSGVHEGLIEARGH